MISSLKLPLKYVVQMIFVFALTACVQVSSPTEHLSAAPSAQEATEMPTQKPSKTSAPTPTQTPYPFSNPDVKITGEEEVVFDWSVDRCEAENIPDLSTRAFRDASEQVNLIISHYVGYRMVGPNLNNVKIDCDQPIMSSERDSDPSMYNDATWISAPYTEDGNIIYSLAHMEYQGHTHPGQCPQNEYFPCWYNALTLAVSKDGGKTFNLAAMPPDQLVASYPIKYESGIGPVGYRGPSNIIKGPEDYYYSVVARYDMNDSKQTSCLMRTNDLSDPTSWRFWDGSGFEGKFFNPYLDEIENPEEVLCTPLPRDNGVLAGNVTYSTYLDRYIVVDDNSHSTGYGIYFSLSEDLIHWTPKKMIVELPLAAVAGPVLSYGYGTLLDPDSESRNFETIGKTAYLYYTRFNQGHSTLDRDLIRVPIEFFPNETGNAWEFNSEGDSEGWSVWNQLSPLKITDGSLLTRSTDSDPFLGLGNLAIDANSYPVIEINMKVSSGLTDEAQIFFITETNTNYSEANSLRVSLKDDGDFHTYSFDMSQLSGWNGVITEIRLDPVYSPGIDIDIDYVRFAQP